MFEIRKDGRVYAYWEAPELTPDRGTLECMKQAGYRLYVDGALKR